MLPQVNPNAAKEAAEQEVAKIKVPSPMLASHTRADACMHAVSMPGWTAAKAGAESDVFLSLYAQSMIDKYKISEEDVKGEAFTAAVLQT